MFPLIFKSGGFELRTFGVAMMAAVIVAAWMCVRRAPKFGMTKEQMLDMTTWAVVPGVLGARIVYILINYKSEFAGHPERILSWRFEGLTSFGALIFGFLGIALFCKVRKFSVANVLDITATPILVAWGIGRVGCLLNGCCYGHVCDSGLCVDFATAGYHVPAQIVDIILMPAFAIALAMRESVIPKPGSKFAWAIIGFSVSRFIYEFFRAGSADEYEKGIATARYLSGIPITEAQLTSLIMIAIGLFFVCRKPRPQTVPAPESAEAVSCAAVSPTADDMTGP